MCGVDFHFINQRRLIWQNSAGDTLCPLGAIVRVSFPAFHTEPKKSSSITDRIWIDWWIGFTSIFFPYLWHVQRLWVSICVIFFICRLKHPIWLLLKFWSLGWVVITYVNDFQIIFLLRWSSVSMHFFISVVSYLYLSGLQSVVGWHQVVGLCQAINSQTFFFRLFCLLKWDSDYS